MTTCRAGGRHWAAQNIDLGITLRAPVNLIAIPTVVVSLAALFSRLTGSMGARLLL